MVTGAVMRLSAGESWARNHTGEQLAGKGPRAEPTAGFGMLGAYARPHSVNGEKFPFLFEPVIADTELEAIKLRIALPQVGIGDVRPPAGHIERLVFGGGHCHAAACSDREVKRRSIARG